MHYPLFYFYLIHFAFLSISQTDIHYLEHLYQQKEYTLLQDEITKLYREKNNLTPEQQGKICFFQYKIEDTINPYFSPTIQKALQIKKKHSFSNSSEQEQEQYLYHVCLAYSAHNKKDIIPILSYQDTFLTQQHAILFKIRQEYLTKHRKKPIFAAIMSSIIPGLGKVYAGKPTQMIAPLLSTILWTAQAVEIAIKSGYTHFAFWIPISIGSVFYVSNIYGSYTTAKQYNVQQKKLYHAQLDTLLDTFAEHYSQR